MKQRFSSLDIKVIAYEVSTSLVGLRLANIYDLSSRIFLFKFAKPDLREQLIIDSGFRCHLTSFARASAPSPSPFVARLRKFLRTRRVTAVSQIGTDRVIEIQFSDGAYRLFLEFYAGGNIVLTDSELAIIGLLRNVNEGADHEQYRLGSKYDLLLRQNYDGVPTLDRERLKSGLLKAIDKQREQAQKPEQKVKKKGGNALRKALAITTTEFPPVLIDHVLFSSGLGKELLPEDVVQSEELLDEVLSALRTASDIVQQITSADLAQGYILAKRQSSRGADAGQGDDTKNDLVYDDFHPFCPEHLASDPTYEILRFDGFNKTVDEFFSSIEGQKLESKLQEREDQAKRKIEAAQEEQAKRIGALQQAQELNVQKAQAIQVNVERVEEAIEAMNGLLSQGMDWVDIGRLIENGQAQNNPVAQMIKLPLKLHENTVTLLLSQSQYESDDEIEDETDSESSEAEDPSYSGRQAEQRLAVDVDLSLTPWANAKHYFAQKRTAADKRERTAQASQKALKSTERKVMADLKRTLKQEKDLLRPVHKQFWFEKFIYFISSDGYLVLAGEDARQNEILYHRYLKKGDLYVHADLHGAASVIIKNNPKTPDAPIPPATLSQAGNLAVCTSKAWESKAVMSAWWVNSEQVSKTAPTGEYLTSGSFMVRGKKNFLPPAQLQLGFAVMFHISDESKARHSKYRLQGSSDPMPPTPELTDAEIIAGSPIAGGRSSPDSDDDFPDADPSSANLEDDDDEFSDVAPYSGESHTYVGNTKIDTNDGAASDDEDGVPSRRQNPLRSSSDWHDERTDNHDIDADDNDADEIDADDETETTVRDERLASDAVPSASPIAPPTESKVGKQQQQQRKVQQQQASSKEDSSAATAGAYTTAGVSSQKQVRGKRGKAKKIAQKYADQDDEDRAKAMELLGSRKAEERREAEAAAKVAQKETAEEARARRKAQHERAQKEGLEAEEVRRLTLEEGMESLGEEEIAALSQLDTFVGTPLPGDEILEAIPFCAPWDALRRNKYKVKLQPGQQKKGKALREILGKWTKDSSDTKKVDQHSQDTEKIWPREAELIKAWREAEVIGVIPVKQMRVVMAGGANGEKNTKGSAGKGGGRGGKGSRRR